MMSEARMRPSLPHHMQLGQVHPAEMTTVS